MSRVLRQATARDFVRVAKRLGFEFDHQTGSHAVYRRSADQRRVVIAMHAIPIGTARQMLKDLGITLEDFSRLS